MGKRVLWGYWGWKGGRKEGESRGGLTQPKFPINKSMLSPLQFLEQILTQYHIAPPGNHLIEKIRVALLLPLLFGQFSWKVPACPCYDLPV